jgi:acetoin utilization protein AcuB
MTKAVPTVRQYMTTIPYSISPEQKLSLAHMVMQQHHVRHLPVLLAGKLVGVITERDLHLIETLKDVDPHKVTVEDAMSQPVYTVAPDAPLDDVVTEMAERKYGCAVIVQNNKVVGMLTTVDVCKALGELLRKRLQS